MANPLINSGDAVLVVYIAETLWRILKGKWLKPVDYISTDSLLYATNRALAALGTELNINFAHVA